MDEMFYALFYAILTVWVGGFRGWLRRRCNCRDHVWLHWYVWAVVFMLVFYARGYWDWWNHDRLALAKLQNNPSATYNEVYGNHNIYPDLPEKMSAAYKDQLSLAGSVYVITLARWLPTLGWIGQAITVVHVIEQVIRTVRTSWSLGYCESMAMVVILQPGLFQALSMRSIIRCLELLTHSAWYGKLATEGSDAFGGGSAGFSAGPIGWLSKLVCTILAKLHIISGNVHYDITDPADDENIRILVFRTAQECLSLANLVQYIGIGCFALLIAEMMAKYQEQQGGQARTWLENIWQIKGVWFHIVVGLILEAANIWLYFQAHKKDVATRNDANDWHHKFIFYYKPIYYVSMFSCIGNMICVLKRHTELDLKQPGLKFIALRVLLMVSAVLPGVLMHVQCAGDNIANTPPMNSTCQIDHAWDQKFRSARLGPVKAELVNAAILLSVGVVLSCVNLAFWRELPTGRPVPAAAAPLLTCC